MQYTFKRGIYCLISVYASIHVSTSPKKKKKKNVHKFVGWWKEIDKNAFENGQRKKKMCGGKVERKTSNKSLRDHPIKIRKGPSQMCGCVQKKRGNQQLFEIVDRQPHRESRKKKQKKTNRSV